MPCELTIIGALTDEQINKLNASGLSYNNRSNITFTEIIEHYQKTDIICFASTYEGFGMPIIEAQALGKPIITSNVASMPEIAGDTAVLVDPYSVKSIRNAIKRCIEDEQFRIKKIKAGYHNIQRFMPGAICEKYIEVYQKLKK